MSDGPKPADPGDHPDPGELRILVSDRQRRAADVADLVRLATRCLRREGVGRAELSISLVEPDEMADLHVRFMGEEGPTDVLSFPQDEEVGDGPDRRRLLGDVVICPAVAQANNPDVASELRLLLVHGILHLLGYDHEEEAERAEMWTRQEAYTGVRVP
jgi:rRNA maturation RNase YbeY